MEESVVPEVTVMVPTVGDPNLIVPCVQRLLEATTVEGWNLLVVMNPVQKFASSVGLIKQQIEAAISVFNTATNGSVSLDILELDGPKGWAGAVNSGVQFLLQNNMPECVAIMNDDVLVTPGWLARMGNSLEPSKIILQGEVGTFGDEAPTRSAELFGPIGMVGPCSNEVAGVQKVQAPEVRLSNGAAFITDGNTMLDQFGNDFQKKGSPYPMSASFLSGLCCLYKKECLLDLLEEHDGKQCLIRPIYGTGGYDDNDISVRCLQRGWRQVIAASVYVHHLGHQTLDVHFPEAERGLKNAPVYLKQWEEFTSREQRLVAVYRVGWEVPWDVEMLGASLRRICSLADGVAVVTSGDPSVVAKAPHYESVKSRLALPERELVERAIDAEGDKDKLKHIIEQYVYEVSNEVHARPNFKYACQVLPESFNERDERNIGIQLALTLDPDWCLSVDHDEIPEDRITREHLERLMKHPDPGVTHYDVGWLNHWDNPRLMRVDQPWSQGYHSSMRGFRLWRVHHKGHQLILAGGENGLHCGNIPDAGESGKRVAAFRFRHYGYLRAQDRHRKYARYKKLDPDPDVMLTKAGTKPEGGYDHLVNEEGMQMQPYQPKNSVGLTMLWHEGEKLYDMNRWLDTCYGLVDKIVFVWTGPEGTNPSEEMQYVSGRYGVEWVHCPMDDDLGSARNAGVIELQKAGIDWCWVMDPDEHLQGHMVSQISIRRMVETTDSWAWMFRFRNHRPDGNFNWSENTRLFKLQGGILKFNNRVHETIEDGLSELGKRGVHPNVRFAPFYVEHFGLSKGDKATQEKLQRYTRLLVKQIEDKPLLSPGAWVSLGLQFGNDGMWDEQWKCYEMALATAGNGYLPFREAALHHLRKGRALLEMAHQRLSPAHQLHRATEDFIKVLQQNAPDQPVLGAARSGAAVPPEVDLEALLEATKAAGKALKEPLPASATIQDSLAAVANSVDSNEDIT